ncbi:MULTISPECIES: type 4 pilus major pilin [Lonsdalea]|uniref:Pilus assembly protein PilX n=2 Tax=Lonsdalea TaxID=1082702 RepID=A0ACD1JAC3_9GAMM|nr:MULTISPECIES: type 4 pilus major pilin [Lonsdalea]RAT12178.1 pilus assembly protein PilX [Lonsdalea quercina]RAT17855.1 pilus assembly protein PilX [Lonsdalea populi]RAT21754.1 pilus assembly protein PilX [Lonsdalea populi]RAT23689.1 pilus assembly protein PilX [Lonsdalea populi]RAT32537.1 pilus assembly protein PilX [Lonsdalea populi]
MSSKTLAERNHQSDRGWGILEHGSIAIGTVIVICVVGALLWGLWGKKSVGLEVSNLQAIVTNAQQLKQTQGGYNFTSGTTMTGTLIQQGGAPKAGWTIQGTASAGSATLWNSYGGQVVMAPVATDGFNNGFSVTTQKIPQADCISIATQLGSGGAFSAITINSTDYSDGVVSAEAAGKSCSADSGMTGNNKLVFTHNG